MKCFLRTKRPRLRLAQYQTLLVTLQPGSSEHLQGGYPARRESHIPKRQSASSRAFRSVVKTLRTRPVVENGPHQNGIVTAIRGARGFIACPYEPGRG